MISNRIQYVVQFILLILLPISMKAESEISKLYAVISSSLVSESKNTNEDSIKACEQLARLEEINSMDLSLLTETEKQALRDEIGNIQKGRDDYEKGGVERNGHGDSEGMHSYQGGYYVSVSLGLLILLLLIILL